MLFYLSHNVYFRTGALLLNTFVSVQLRYQMAYFLRGRASIVPDSYVLLRPIIPRIDQLRVNFTLKEIRTHISLNTEIKKKKH